MKNIIWRHKKRGTLYVTMQRAPLQASKGAVPEGETIVTYIGLDDGKPWSREMGEFLDGRFEPVEGQDADGIRVLAEALVRLAERHNVVLTVEQRPREPLAMGNFETVVTTRDSRPTC
jgi:hypothetical protein